MTTIQSCSRCGVPLDHRLREEYFQKQLCGFCYKKLGYEEPKTVFNGVEYELYPIWKSITIATIVSVLVGIFVWRVWGLMFDEITIQIVAPLAAIGCFFWILHISNAYIPMRNTIAQKGNGVDVT